MNTGISMTPQDDSIVRLPVFWGLAILVLASSAAQRLPQDMHDMAMASIDYVFKEKFRLAEEEGKKIIKEYPDHPAGYFFCAAALESWMSYYESDNREEEFYRYCNEAIEKAENILSRDPGDVWAMFFMGGADGIKGTYESRYERWITAFRHGWKGVATLQALYKRAPEIRDINYGLGIYDYWRSALTRILWWMPGIENKCQQGIQELYDAKNNGLYTGISASVNLLFILCNEKRYKDALTIADEMLGKFPSNLTFFWGKANALFGDGRYEEAETIYRYILERVEAEPYDNHFNAVVCHLWLAKIYLKTKRYTQSIAECNRMVYYNLDEEIKRRLGKYFNEAGRIKAQAKAASLKNPEAEIVP